MKCFWSKAEVDLNQFVLNIAEVGLTKKPGIQTCSAEIALGVTVFTETILLPGIESGFSSVAPNIVSRLSISLQ